MRSERSSMFRPLSSSGDPARSPVSIATASGKSNGAASRVAAGRRSQCRPPACSGVSPSGRFVLPAIVLAQSSGKGSLLLTIPNIPALHGYSLLVQGLILPTTNPSPWRLTNVLAEVSWR